MLELLLLIVLFLNFIYGFYFVGTTIWGFLFPKEETIQEEQLYKYAFLIPARNEEKVIGNLVNSIKHMNYPKEKFEIFVLPNHCTDNTEEIALTLGASTIKISDKVKTKGDVLNEAFKHLLKKDFDAFIIFDADNIVHPDFLKEMNHQYNQGDEVIQGFRDSKNAFANWLSGGYTCFYLIQNFFYQARKKLNLSAAISGTGFLISKNFIKKYGYTTHTITEDMELAALCALNKVKIGFAKKAITYDEQPTKWFVSWKQRKRWSTGAYQCLYNYGNLLVKGIKQSKMACFDMFLVFFSPFLQVITTIVTVLYSVFLLMEFNSQLVITTALLSLITSYVLVLFFAFFIILYHHKNPFKMWKGLLLFPIFVASWIPIQFVTLFKPVRQWEEIHHVFDVNVEEILKKVNN